jgi:hypothetical protein
MQFERLDLYVGAAVLIAVLLIALAWKIVNQSAWSLPSVQDIQELATMCNTKGGIVLLLVTMWAFTLTIILIFSIWVIIKGIDPQNAIVVLVLGMMTSGAFGTINGALFRTMTGEDPKAPAGVSTETTSTKSTATTEVAAPTVQPAAPAASQTGTAKSFL